MATPRFLMHPSFPATKCSFRSDGAGIWKMQVREWAFAQVNIDGKSANIRVDSNNPKVVPGAFDATKKKLETTVTWGTENATVRFFADGPGFTIIFADQGPGTQPENNTLQVEVLQRKAMQPQAVSLAELKGKTVAISAPGMRVYEMDHLLPVRPAAGISNFFKGVPSDANHIAIASHGVYVRLHDTDLNTDSVCLAVFGGNANDGSNRIDLNNVEEVFKPLKGNVAQNCVVWIGGCAIGANREFCAAAAKASGCAIVAPAYVLPNTRYPKNRIDLLDRASIAVAFGPDGKRMEVPDFCARQDEFNFAVPV